VIVAGWLFNAARLTALNAVRIESRRENGERKAAQRMEEASKNLEEGADLGALSLIDDGLMKLGEQDRNAVLLRYAQGLSIVETATMLNVTPETARKRTSRGIEHLRRYCLNHGGAISAVVIAAVLGEKSAHAAVEAARIAKIGNVSSLLHSNSSIHLIYQGALKIMVLSKATAAATVVIAGIILVGGGSYAVVRANQTPTQNGALAASASTNGGAGPTNEEIAEAQKKPMAMAQMFFRLLSIGDTDKAYSLFAGVGEGKDYTEERTKSELKALSGLKVIGIGYPQKADFSWRMSVPYNIEIKSKTVQTATGPVILKRLISEGHLSVRNDNPAQKWAVDGGIPDGEVIPTERSSRKKLPISDDASENINENPQSAKETAQSFLSFLAIGDTDKAYSLVQGVGYMKLPKKTEEMLKSDFDQVVGLKIISIGDPVAPEGQQSRWMVSYIIERESETFRTVKGLVAVKGVREKGDLFLDNSNPSKRWEVDGGMP